jgi:hypothetical protein
LKLGEGHFGSVNSVLVTGTFFRAHCARKVQMGVVVFVFLCVAIRPQCSVSATSFAELAHSWVSHGLASSLPHLTPPSSGRSRKAHHICQEHPGHCQRRKLAADAAGAGDAPPGRQPAHCLILRLPGLASACVSVCACACGSWVRMNVCACVR